MTKCLKSNYNIVFKGKSKQVIMYKNNSCLIEKLVRKIPLLSLY